jgi:NADH:ubiquinone oxidoreductase subunit 5 (subunit L)/multisubunit Na+/H+ antiporter MnhA subunit
MAGLALIGGLAAACFAKVFGVVFLGERRHAPPAEAREAGPAMVGAMVALALGCLGVGLWPRGALSAVEPALSALAGTPPGADAAALASARVALEMISWVAVLLIGLIAILGLARRALLNGREIRRAPTWGCGFTAPTARMQYTGSSFAMPLVGLFRGVLGTRTEEERPQGYFPAAGRLATHTPDAARARLFEPLFARLERGLDGLRFLQQGRVQLYLLYIVLTLIALLVWEIGF